MKNPITRIFTNDSNVVWVIVAFVVLLLTLFAIVNRADAAEQSLTVEAGSAVLRGETPVIGLNITCERCGPVNTDYEYGFDLIGASHEKHDNPNTIHLHAQLVDGYGPYEMGLGFYYFNMETEYVCQFGFHLMARWNFTDRFGVQWRHSSSAGSCRPNAGRDLLTVGWKF